MVLFSAVLFFLDIFIGRTCEWIHSDLQSLLAEIGPSMGDGGQTLLNLIDDCQQGNHFIDRYFPFRMKEILEEIFVEVNRRISKEFLRWKDLSFDVQTLLTLLRRVNLQEFSLYRSLLRFNQLLLLHNDEQSIPSHLVTEVKIVSLRIKSNEENLFFL